ncbi:MAG: replication factor C small subunit [Candidatus Micrarchaeota archaeon]
MSEDYYPWIEKYRPKKLGEIIGHEYITARLNNCIKKNNLPHMMFAGRAGIGKTTAALALAQELYGEHYRESFLEMNASDERKIDDVRTKVKDFARTIPISGVSFKIIFLDEADALTPDAQNALRRTMEQYSKITRFILSCNYSSRIIEPIQSRCAIFRFSPLTDENVEKIIERVVSGEKVIIDDDATKAVIYLSEGDARKAINILQGAAGIGKKITEEIVYQVSSRARPKEISEMVSLALNGKFTEARNHLNKLMIDYAMSGEDVISQIYREVIKLDVDDETKVKLVDRVGEYDFRMSEGTDERIQLEALLAQIMLAGKK